MATGKVAKRTTKPTVVRRKKVAKRTTKTTVVRRKKVAKRTAKPTVVRRNSEKTKPLDKKNRQIFVAYSYRLYPKDDYRRCFKELQKKYGVTFIFADEKITNMHIMKKIESYIRGSDFSIFDISGWNPNVTLELGFAMAISENWFITLDPSKTTVDEVPSDLRGLDRIQYSSFSELGAKLTALLDQRYSEKKRSSIEDYLTEQRAGIKKLLRKQPGLTITSIAQLLQIEVPVAQLAMKPMADMLETKGRRKGMQYFLKGAGRAGKNA